MSRNALLSVYDKTGIEEFAAALVELGWNVFSSGGTAKALITAGIPVTDVAELVGGQAILGHRVVTLSREVHAGLLARYGNEQDAAELDGLGIPYIDLVCVDLYPLAAEIAGPYATTESVIEKTDIGGPTMLNAGAKGGRIVIGDLADYGRVLDWLRAGEPDAEQFRRELAAKAHFITANYYLPAAAFHSDDLYGGVTGRRVEELKYGENPYMNPAGLYAAKDEDPLAVHCFELIEGDSRSLVGLTDVDRLLQYLTHIAAGFEQNFGAVPCIAVGVKHGNACGAAVGDDPVTVIKQMVAGDKRAIFGGVIMTNFPITREVAEALMEQEKDDPPRLFDGVFAPSFDLDAPEVLKRYQGKCRMMANPALLELGIASLDTTPRIRQVRGGFLRQPNYTFVLDLNEATVHSGRAMNEQQRRDLVLAWAIGSMSNSNTITLVRGGQLIGNGVGQQDRVGAADLAVKRARDADHQILEAVAYSDSFFPAPDGPEALADACVVVILTSSGSRRDAETIEACRKADVTLVTLPDGKIRGFSNH